jgi:hypothetical protein
MFIELTLKLQKKKLQRHEKAYQSSPQDAILI